MPNTDTDQYAAWAKVAGAMKGNFLSAGEGSEDSSNKVVFAAATLAAVGAFFY